MRAAVDLERIRREQRRRANAITAAPTFRGANATAQTITDLAWILSGSAGTGKTMAALWRLDSEARKHPGSSWVLARKIRVTMDSTVLNTWRTITAMRGGVRAYGGQHPQWYDYANGARVWVIGMDNPGKVLSGEFDGVVINQAEELDEADFETLTTRVTGRGAVTATPMVWGDCNPGGADHWIIRRRDAKTLTLLESHYADNPSLYDDAGVITAQGERTMAVHARLTGVRYLRLHLGQWVGAEGMYYTQLDAARHVIPLGGVPAHWQVWGALDYGFAHPLAFGLFALDDFGRVIVCGVHTAHKWYIPQHVAAMDDLLAVCGVDKRNLRIVAGHDCWATGKDDPETIADKFAAQGYQLERATIARVIGARAIGERLGNPESDPPIEPTLLFAERALPAFEALTRMVHDPRNPEDVLKVNADAEGRGGDDVADMVRYGCLAVPGGTVDAYGAVGGSRPALGALARSRR